MEDPHSLQNFDDARVWHAVDRFLMEIVEELNVCPYARQSRLQGLVQKKLFRPRQQDDVNTTGKLLADSLSDAAVAIPEPEAVLMVFVLPAEHAWQEPLAFEKLLRSMQQDYGTRAAPPFYSVMFHPRLDASLSFTSPTPANFVSALRRSPYPMIQCLRASVMDAVRKKAQQQAEKRIGREVQAMLGGSSSVRPVLAESELSRSIAQANFENLACGSNRKDLEKRLAELWALALHGRDRR